jgi:hypothetical protein
MFDRLAEHHEGEAMSPIMKPDRRKEEYVCSACMMDLVTDVYNRLHTRDEMVFCPSCRRILYIPDELPPDLAVNKKKASSVSSSASSDAGESGGQPARPKEPSRAKGKLGQLLTAAQGESVKNAVDADQKPIEFQVTVDGKMMGAYKGKTQENLERIIKFRMDEAKLTHEVKVEAVPVAEAEAPATIEATETPVETTETSAAPEAPAADEPAPTESSSSAANS